MEEFHNDANAVYSCDVEVLRCVAVNIILGFRGRSCLMSQTSELRGPVEPGRLTH